MGSRPIEYMCNLPIKNERFYSIPWWSIDADNKEEFKEKQDSKQRLKNCGLVLMQGLLDTFHKLI
jgi:hypothetical protein